MLTAREKRPRKNEPIAKRLKISLREVWVSKAGANEEGWADTGRGRQTWSIHRRNQDFVIVQHPPL
jgi:hypothetical protein